MTTVLLNISNNDGNIADETMNFQLTLKPSRTPLKSNIAKFFEKEKYSYRKEILSETTTGIPLDAEH